jgi:diguanylate cyclase (GGDEF)-like protein
MEPNAEARGLEAASVGDGMAGTGAALADRYLVLLELARALSLATAPAALYETILAHVARIVPATGAVLALSTPDAGPQVMHRTGVGADLDIQDDELMRLGTGDYLTRDTGRRAALIAPLLREHRLVGLLALERADGPPFQGCDAHFLLGVGGLCGVALDNPRLIAQAHRGRAEAEHLETIARTLGGSLDFSDVVERIANGASDLVDKPVALWVLEGERLRAVARAGGALIRLGEERAFPARAIQELKASWAPAGAGRDRAIPRESGRSLVPLLQGDRLIGVLAVGPFLDEQPDPARLAVLGRMAPLAASALENARLHAEVRRLSLTDPLVQLPNRRQLDLFLNREFAAAQRGRPLFLVLFDLDRFKAYNDTHGHRPGDVALIRFADILRGETRAMNLAARYGGEEFAVVLAGTNQAGAQAYAERVRRRVVSEFHDTLTVSAGVAECLSTMESPIDLVVAADRALYRAKLEGRNRVTMADG